MVFSFGSSSVGSSTDVGSNNEGHAPPPGPFTSSSNNFGNRNYVQSSVPYTFSFHAPSNNGNQHYVPATEPYTFPNRKDKVPMKVPFTFPPRPPPNNGSQNRIGRLKDYGTDIESGPSEPTFSFLRPFNKGTCTICYCEYTPTDGVQLQSCLHQFCEECFSQYVRTKARDGEVDGTQMACPFLCGSNANKKCGKPLMQQDVLACLESAEDRDRYLRLTLSKVVDTADNMACCLTPGCNFVFEWDEQSYKLHCPSCSKRYCMKCNTEWHSGVSCEENQRRQSWSKDDRNFHAFAEANKLKQCPKCKFWVEKKSGCNSMHCRCNLVFCFQCGGCLANTARQNNFKECHCHASITHMQADEGHQSRNLRGEGNAGGFDFTARAFDFGGAEAIAEANRREAREEANRRAFFRRILGADSPRADPPVFSFGDDSPARGFASNNPPAFGLATGPAFGSTPAPAPASSFEASTLASGFSAANPFGATSFGASPFDANPFGANQFGANPFGTRVESHAESSRQRSEPFFVSQSVTVGFTQPSAFGATQTNETATQTPAFSSSGQGSSVTSSAARPFSFGSNTNHGNTAGSGPTQVPGFSLTGQGSSVTPSTSAPFSFGSNANNGTADRSQAAPRTAFTPSTSTPFSFGSNANNGTADRSQAAPRTAFNLGSSVSSPPAFSFGSPATAQTTAPSFGTASFPSTPNPAQHFGSQFPTSPSFGRNQAAIGRCRDRHA